MKKKVREWLELNGRRLVELKLLGGRDIFNNKINLGVSKLTREELFEFLILTGQIDALIWILSPKEFSKQDKMMDEISNYLKKLEDEIKHITKETGLSRTPKGEA